MEGQLPRLKDYHISEEFGFLLDLENAELSEYFSAWTSLNGDLPSLVEKHALRAEVDVMPLLDHRRLHGYRQKRLAFTMLTFIGNGYIWQEREQGIAKVVPRQLAVPWCGLAEELGLQTCISQPPAALSNWRRPDPSRPLGLDNMQCVSLLPGGRSSEWFLLVNIQAEVEAVSGIKSIEQGMEGVLEGDALKVKAALESISSAMDNMRAAIGRFHDEMDADSFYNGYRIFVAGWGGEGSPAPDGILFEGVSETRRQVRGWSAGQSSTIQSFDAALSITHGSERQDFLDLLLTYMPPAHADFIRAIRKGPSIKKFVEVSGDNELKATYNGCVKALAAFRSYHIQIVSKYIVIPANKAARDSDCEEVRGTGGTVLMPFLKSIRDSTNTFQMN